MKIECWKIVSIVIGSIAFIAWLFCFKMISPGYVGVVVDLLGDNAELIQWQAVQKWDGHMPHVTSGAMPFIEVK